MRLAGRVVAVTGAARGLGAALAAGAAARGASVVAAIDLDVDQARAVAMRVGGIAVRADVSDEASLRAAIDQVERSVGSIDIFVSNAGIGGPTDIFSLDTTWLRQFSVHVLSNVYAARMLLPGMLGRGSGHLVATASCTALTSSPISAVYTATKHAQLALAEWLAMTYGDRGIEVTCFCPKGMVTPMLVEGAQRSAYARASLTTAVSPGRAAQLLLDGVEAGTFLVTTHDSVLEEFALKVPNYESYIAHLRSLHAELAPEVGIPSC